MTAGVRRKNLAAATACADRIRGVVWNPLDEGRRHGRETPFTVTDQKARARAQSDRPPELRL